MNDKNKALFQTLVKTYYNDTFEDTVNNLFNDDKINKEDLAKTISTLSGVVVNFNDDFVSNLKKAITSYNANEKIVHKLSCNRDCSGEDGKSPCQCACPFNAILTDPITKLNYIDLNLCTDCGMCISACKSEKFLDRVEFIPLANLLKENKTVIAAVAPAICGQFGEDVSMDQLRAAFMAAGFKDMVEVAFFADMLTLKESIEFNHMVHSKDDLMITSCCCPMWVGMLKKVYGELVKHVSPSVSPMIAAGRVLKLLNPDAKVVFIGPCLAKKAEAKEKDLIGDIDYVLTFEELKGIFEVLEITPAELQGVPSLEYASKGGRLYARTGGVSIAVSDAIKELFPEKHKLFTPVQAHGVKDCKAILDKAMNKNIDANFIEGMGCLGGCVGGPKALIPKEQGKDFVDRFALDSSYTVATHSDIMLNILKRIGINSIEDFHDPEKVAIFERKF